MNAYKKAIKHFFNNITINLGIYDWTLRLVPNSTEGYCWHYNNQIDVGEKNSDPKRLILHELAHVNTCRFCNNKHDSTFWKLYKELLYKVLKKDFDEGDLLHKRHSDGIGYYKMCYRRENV